MQTKCLKWSCLIILGIIIMIMGFPFKSAHADRIAPPDMRLETHSDHIFYWWHSIEGANGYLLYYAPPNTEGDPDLNRYGIWDLGRRSSGHLYLPCGTRMWLAAQGYTEDSRGRASPPMFFHLRCDSDETLPADVSVVSVNGENGECSLDCLSTEAENCISTCDYDPGCIVECPADPECLGEGFTFLTLRMYNASETTYQYEMERGVGFEPLETSSQRMIFMGDMTLEVSPGENIFCLPVYCTTRQSDSPAAQSRFHFGGVDLPGCLGTIADLMEGKKISDPYRFQQILWDCLENPDGVSEQDWAWLEGLTADG